MGQWDSVSRSRKQKVSGQLSVSCALYIPFSLSIETLSVLLSNKDRMLSVSQSCTWIPPSPFTPCLALDRLIYSFVWLTIISLNYSCLKQSHQPSDTGAESALFEWRHQPKSSKCFWDLEEEVCSCTTVTLASISSPVPTFCRSLKWVTEKLCRRFTDHISLVSHDLPSVDVYWPFPVLFFSLCVLLLFFLKDEWKFSLFSCCQWPPPVTQWFFHR